MIVKQKYIETENIELSYTCMGRNRIQIWFSGSTRTPSGRTHVKKQQESEILIGLG